MLEADASHPPDIDLGPHIARLQELLQLIVSYVPEYAGVARRVLPSARPGYISRVQGTLLAADLSGFTAFSARLSTLGSEGAELVAHTVSALFSDLLETLGGWGGNLLKLSGDALTALFTGLDPAPRAIAAALALQQRMEAFQALATPAGTFTLRMRIGLASGDVVLAEVGSPDRVELLVAGATARRVMEFQQRATPGAVVIGSATYREIGASCHIVTLSSGLYGVLAMEPLPRSTRVAPPRWIPRHDPVWELHALVGRIEALRPYLVDQHLERMAAGPPALAGEGDLRPVTVLFASLTDAGTLLERAESGDEDPALARLQANAQRLWAIVEQHGGTINKLDLHPDGHTLIALFGAPIAQGRDAEHAVSCALALLRHPDLLASDLGAQPHGTASGDAPLLVRRIGLATGRVFAGAVGSASRREYTVMGSVANLAARLMNLAADGQVLIDVSTAQMVGRQFQFEQQPPALIKGYEQPVPFYVVRVEQRSRISKLTRSQAPLIGRAAELAQAIAGVTRALAGHSSIIALIGEAGIGKSRLLAEIVRLSLATVRAGATVAIVQTQPHSRVQPYSVIAEAFRQLYELPDQAEAAARALAAHVGQTAPEHERFLPLLPTIFGLPGEERAITQALAPDERRARLRELAVGLLNACARAKPLALVLEDLHWADSASIEMLGALATADGTAPLLLLCTYRPEHAAAWPAAANLTPIELRPLTPEQSQALLNSWVGPLALSQELRAAVVERTLGNPFFIEETTRALHERDLAVDAEPPLPASIQGALLARLDKLPLEERYVLQTASVIGPLFQRDLLADLAGHQVVLERALERLADLGLVRYTGDERYSFAHSLTQETAYESLLFAQRRELHRRIADHLRGGAAEHADADPNLLAYHYRRAEAWPEALEYAWRAGQRAQSLYAGDIALGHYRHALEAADHCDDAIAAERRPAILRRIGDLHALAGRYAEAIVAYQTALETSLDEHERAEVLICWAEVFEQQASYDDALAMLDRAAAILPPHDVLLALRVAVRRGWVLVRRGSADEARAAVEPCLEQLEAHARWQDLLLAYKVFFHIAISQSRWSEARSYLRLALMCAEQAGDIREIARIHNNMGIVLTQEGDLQGAARECEQAAVVMQEIGDRNTLASVEVNIGVIYYKIGDYAAALDHYDTSLQIATMIGARPIASIVRGNLGEIYRRLGRLDESLEQLLQSVELCRQTEDDLGLAEAYRQLAETYIALDRLADAEQAAERASVTASAAGDPQTEAIVYRVRSMLAAQRGDYETALADARRSIQMLTELGSTHELGQSMITQATMLIHEGQAGAACEVLAEAVHLLDHAGAIADRAQAEALIDQARAQMKEFQR